MTSLDERVAVLEDRFNRHETDSLSYFHRIDARIESISAQMTELRALLTRYDWMARTVMGTLLFLGMFAGWLIDKAHVIKAWILK